MRRNMARFSRGGEESEINLTPMLDVVFIMLIFFIVTATFIKEPGTDVTRPDALSSRQKNPTILVGINRDQEIWIDKTRVQPAKVRAVLERLYAENPKGGMVIQADEGAKNELLMVVLDAARGAKIESVAVATDQ